MADCKLDSRTCFHRTSGRVRLEVLPERKTIFPKALTIFAETIIAEVKDTQELQKELQNAKKLAHERAEVITLRIPKLKDCENHFDKKKEKGPPRGIWQ